MAHVQNIKQVAVAPMVAHYERVAELERGYRRDNIDPERTTLNYNLRPADVRQEVGLAIAQHEQTSGKRIRKDANVLCDWVVTLPQDCPRGRSRDFFEAVAEFMEGRYGKGNVLGCYVHMDETTPHAHIPILPMRDGKLVASKVINRADLKSFHGDLGKAVDAALGFHVSIELDEEQHLEKALAKSTKGLEEFKKAKDGARAEIDAAADEAERRLECLRRAEEDETRAIGELDRAIEQAELQPPAETLAESVRTLLAAREDGEREESLASEIDGLRGRISELEWANREARERVAKLEEGLLELRGRYQELEQRFEDAKAAVRKVVEGLRKIPDNVSEWTLDIAYSLGIRWFTYQTQTAPEVAERVREGREEEVSQGAARSLEDRARQLGEAAAALNQGRGRNHNHGFER